MKPDVLTQKREVCDHPEEDCVTSDTNDVSIWCKKCNTTFSRYERREIEENRRKYGGDYAFMYFDPDWNTHYKDITQSSPKNNDLITPAQLDEFMNRLSKGMKET